MWNIVIEGNYSQHTALVGQSKIFFIWNLKLSNKPQVSGESLCKGNISFHQDCLSIEVLLTYQYGKGDTV